MRRRRTAAMALASAAMGRVADGGPMGGSHRGINVVCRLAVEGEAPRVGSMRSGAGASGAQLVRAPSANLVRRTPAGWGAGGVAAMASRSKSHHELTVASSSASGP